MLSTEDSSICKKQIPVHCMLSTEDSEYILKIPVHCMLSTEDSSICQKQIPVHCMLSTEDSRPSICQKQIPVHCMLSTEDSEYILKANTSALHTIY